MTDNTSATGGYIVPTSASPDEDTLLITDIQPMIVGITGLPGHLVRPRWQAIPPKQPEADIDWCAVGIMSQDSEANISTRHDDGSSTTFENLTLEVMVSFYGPHSGANASSLRVGLMVPQNREEMFVRDMALVGMPGRTSRMAELVGQVFIDRSDLTFFIRRKITRVWPIENLTGAEITIHADVPHDNPPDSIVTIGEP